MSPGPAETIVDHCRFGGAIPRLGLGAGDVLILGLRSVEGLMLALLVLLRDLAKPQTDSQSLFGALPFRSGLWPLPGCALYRADLPSISSRFLSRWRVFSIRECSSME